MRRLRVLGIGVVMLVGLIGAVPTASAAGPPAYRETIGPIIETVDCGGRSITRTESGWVSYPFVPEPPINYHITWVYSNAAGAVWTYIDTGVIRAFWRDGDLFVMLSGHSVNVGPGDTGWFGHWVQDQVTGEVWRAGLGVGVVDQLACSVLAP